MLMQVGASVVLLYHRVGRAYADPWELTVSVDHFAEHMEVLRRDCRLLSLQDLVHGCGAAADVPRVAITFDDGYAETVTSVLPILKQFEIPATLFIPSGSLDAT